MAAIHIPFPPLQNCHCNDGSGYASNQHCKHGYSHTEHLSTKTSCGMYRCRVGSTRRIAHITGQHWWDGIRAATGGEKVNRQRCTWLSSMQLPWDGHLCDYTKIVHSIRSEVSDVSWSAYGWESETPTPNQSQVSWSFMKRTIIQGVPSKDAVRRELDGQPGHSDWCRTCARHHQTWDFSCASTYVCQCMHITLEDVVIESQYKSSKRRKVAWTHA